MEDTPNDCEGADYTAQCVDYVVDVADSLAQAKKLSNVSVNSVEAKDYNLDRLFTMAHNPLLQAKTGARPSC